MMIHTRNVISASEGSCRSARKLGKCKKVSSYGLSGFLVLIS